MLLCSGGSLAVKYESVNNQSCIDKPALDNLNCNELYDCSLLAGINKCDVSCYTDEDPLFSICVPNKIGNARLKAFNMITGINESKTLMKHISYYCRYKFEGGRFNSNQKRNNDEYQCECENPIKRCVCKAIMMGILEDCETDENLKNCTCMKNLAYNSVITCCEIVNTSETVSIESIDTK